MKLFSSQTLRQAPPSPDKNKNYWAVSPAEKQLVSSLGDHLNYNTADFTINKTCIRYTVRWSPVRETMLIINNGFKHILKILSRMFHKCKVLAVY